MRYSRFRVHVRELDAAEWLFPLRGPHGQIFVRGVEAKAIRRGGHDLHHST
jgi:hypothetical protein